MDAKDAHDEDAEEYNKAGRGACGFTAFRPNPRIVDADKNQVDNRRDNNCYRNICKIHCKNYTEYL